jgi:hypothetical protein
LPQLEFDVSSHREAIGLVEELSIPLPAAPRCCDSGIRVVLLEVLPPVHRSEAFHGEFSLSRT